MVDPPPATPAARPRRVLDLSWSLAGAYAAHLLAVAGFEVRRLEPPGGHALRRWRARRAPIGEGATGALFQWLAGGQASATVDPDVAADVAAVHEWLSVVDAVLWSPGSPLTQHRSLSIDVLRRVAPDIVLTAITPFGLDGPWAGRAATEFTLQALSGGPALRGSRAWPPMSTGGQHGEYMAGVFAAVATYVALFERDGSGHGGVVDLSALEAVIMTQLFNPITMQSMVDGPVPRRPKATVADVVPTKDGYVGFAVVNRVQHWHDFCRMIDQPAWAEDPTLDPVPLRTERADELNPVIRAWAGERTTAEIVELASLWRIPAIEVGHGASLPAMDHFAEAGFFERNPVGGFVQPAAPFRLHPGVPGVGACRAAPAPGPGLSTLERPPAPERAGPSTPALGLPFAGLRIADLTSFWAGPFLGHTMAMFGADVIHIESTSRPDGARTMVHKPVTEPRWWEWSAYFQATNTNKRDVTIDMTSDEGRDLARRLVAQCDVLVENYSPRVLESWGLGWEEVHALRPDLVMVRMPAFGLSGPWRDRTGFAMTMEQVSGMAWLTGFPEHDPGALFGPCDPSAGLHAVLGLLCALDVRGRTGEGMLVEAPMVAGALNVAAEQVIEHSAYGVLLERAGNRGIAAAPQNCYRCADCTDDGIDRWLALAVSDDEQWRALVAVIGEAGWIDDAELATAAGRWRRHDELDGVLAAWCAERSAQEAVATLSAAGVPAAPVVHPWEQLGFEQLHARRFFETVRHPVSGETIHVTYPFRLPTATGPVHRRAAPLLGEHNDEVLREIVGLSAEEVLGLRARGVIGETVAG